MQINLLYNANIYISNEIKPNPNENTSKRKINSVVKYFVVVTMTNTLARGPQYYRVNFWKLSSCTSVYITRA